jgi:hypothetical protein
MSILFLYNTLAHPTAEIAIRLLGNRGDVVQNYQKLIIIESESCEERSPGLLQLTRRARSAFWRIAVDSRVGLIN